MQTKNYRRHEKMYDELLPQGELIAMPVIRVNKTQDYTVMANYHFRNHEMSLKAKGLLSQMLSLPEDWNYSIEGLTTLAKDGYDSIKEGLKELERFGYLKRAAIRDKGKITDWIYNIYEKPQMEKPQVEKPQMEKPQMEKPQVEKPQMENPRQLITKELITKELSTKESSIAAAANEEIKIDSSTYSPSIYSKTIPSNDLDEIMSRWNDCNNTIPINGIVPLSKRWNELQFALVTFGKDKLLEAINKIDSSEWLTSRAKTGNKAKFDTWINIDNIQKLLEGNFENDFSKAKSPESDGYEITL